MSMSSTHSVLNHLCINHVGVDICRHRLQGYFRKHLKLEMLLIGYICMEHLEYTGDWAKRLTSCRRHLQMYFLDRNVWCFSQSSLKFLPKSPIDHTSATVQVMVRCRVWVTYLVKWAIWGLAAPCHDFSILRLFIAFAHDDVIKWKHFPRYWPFVRGIHRSPVNSPHKGQSRGALMFSLICVWINGWVNNREAGDWDAIVPIMTSP